MATSFPHAQLERFRREAKKLGRELSITHSEALDRIAAQHGFTNWSLLAKHSEGAPPAPPRSTAVPAGPDSGYRYYLHGDVEEDDPTKCYCARCDLFVEHTHFGATAHHSGGTDGERYLASLTRWQRLSKSDKGDRRRPDEVPNVLAASAVAARDAFEASRAPFHRWLAAQKGRNDPVGDLASDAVQDKAFPVAAVTRREVEDYVSRHGDHVVKAVRQAWREFSGAKVVA